jgi:hypothetical protein
MAASLPQPQRLTSPLSGNTPASLHSSPTNNGGGQHHPHQQRPQSDRADDILPKGTLFRWNPYVSTPTNNGGTPGTGGAGGDVHTGVTPGGTVSPSTAGGGPNAQRNKHLQARGAPINVISPRADGAAADCLSTPLADDGRGGGGGGVSGALSPGGDDSGFVSMAAATVDAETGEALPRRVIELTATPGGLAIASDSNDPVERTIVALVEEQRDAEVRTRILALQQREANLLYAHLVRNTQLCEFLCFKQRGKIFADAIEAAAEALDNADLFRWMFADILRFVHDQSACIAVTRVYDVVPAALRATIDDFVALNFVDLATHAYGNYAVQRVIKTRDPDIVGSMARQLRSRGVIASLTTSKAGSHVVEKFVTGVPLTDVLPVCRVLLTSDPALVTALANDRYGNYVLQASLRKVFDTRKVLQAAEAAGEGGSPASPVGDDSARAEALAIAPGLKQDVLGLAETCLTDVPPLVAASPNNANVNRAMGIKVASGAKLANDASGRAQDSAKPAAGNKGGNRLSASALRRGVPRR